MGDYTRHPLRSFMIIYELLAGHIPEMELGHL